MKKFLVGLLILISLTSCDTIIQTENQNNLYEVVRVVDGDTVILNIDGQRTRVRLIGIDTPESVAEDKSRNVKEGKIASEYTKNLLENKKVRLEFDDEKKDVYERKLGYVFLDDEFINEKLLKEGMAKLYTKTTNQKYSERLKKAEEYARENKKGFWKDFYVNDPNLYIKYTDSKGRGMIKGNINNKGLKIYHMPNQKSYKDVKINFKKGEKYFVTEKKAQDEGFSKSSK
ncbi:MAG: thermonuclease family protein [Finegoldia magna]|uniref:thermonuclease family protein n=1 Tax=Finegoldia magna TaxID=1260 RepID=UPI0028FF3B62|nr:thermonuclease family protein [Finegoldia magna]MDU2639809.1 thermonuclease family protein [Finegoldia magna]